MTPAPDYVLPVDKPEGPTSHDVVDGARRALGTRKIGHTGTLDPFASGLLILCVGRATRLAEYLSGLDKEYEAVARLGISTDTLDRDGDVVSTSDGWRGLSEQAVVEAVRSFEGEIEQTPPQFSAKKVDGEPMHRRARRGERVTLSACAVTIHSIELVGMELPDVRLQVRCSSGTYIRSLARDLGHALGVGGHLTALRRTSIGEIGVESAVSVSELAEPTAVGRARIELLDALRHLPSVSVDDAEALRLAHGQKLRVAPPPLEGLVVVASGNRLVAIAEAEDGLLSPRKVFHS